MDKRSKFQHVFEIAFLNGTFCMLAAQLSNRISMEWLWRLILLQIERLRIYEEYEFLQNCPLSEKLYEFEDDFSFVLTKYSSKMSIK